MSRRIAVIGGGISGLSTCHFLKQQLNNCHIILFEKSDRFGGYLKTCSLAINNHNSSNPRNIIPLEAGPNSIRGGNSEKTKILTHMLHNLHLTTNDLVYASPSASAKRYLYTNNKIVQAERIAMRMIGVPMFTWIPFMQLYYYLKGGHIHRYLDESVEDFYVRNFGLKMTKNLVSAFVNGVYGGGIHHLSVQACAPFNYMKNIEMEYGSFFYGAIAKQFKTKESANNSLIKIDVNSDEINLDKVSSFTFIGGMQMFIQRLISSLMDAECNLTLELNKNCEIVSIENNHKSLSLKWKENENSSIKESEFDHIICAIEPNHGLSNILDLQRMENDWNLKDFNFSASMISLNLIWNKVNNEEIYRKFDGFGILMTRDLDECRTHSYCNHNLLAGIIYHHCLFPQLYDDNLLSLIFMFGGPEFNVDEYDDQEWITLVTDKLLEVYDIDIKGEEISVVGEEVDEESVHEMDGDYSRIILKINRLPECISHYKVGHLQKMEQLNEQIEGQYGNRLSLVGSGFDGVGISDCILSAHQCVEKMMLNMKNDQINEDLDDENQKYK